jgi:2-dehydro-3-deoxygalactonokinase
MGAPAFVAGDWGTSHLRLNLCDEQGRVLETRDGPGINAAGGNIPATFFLLVRGWDEAHGALPAVLCGMAGSTIGWRETPYLPCPVLPEAIAIQALRFEAQGRTIAIAPGLSCINRLGGPDVMRGEETQILGALGLEPQLREGRHLLCLPGTHTKWVLLDDGAVEQFLTGVSGELYDVLRRHSILVRDAAEADDGPAFQKALEQTRLHPDADLIHLLFATRSRQLSGELKREDAASYLSGLVIGRDIAGALRLFGPEPPGHVILIGTPSLTRLYEAALQAHGVATTAVDGARASLAGLTELHEALRKADFGHAA